MTVTKWGSEFLVNTTTTSYQNYFSSYDRKVAGGNDGRFLATWTDWSHTGPDTSGTAVRAQLFNADGSKAGAELTVNTSTIGYQRVSAVAALGNGQYVVTWNDASGSADPSSSGDVRGQILNADGSASGSEFLVNTTLSSVQADPSVAALSGGGFIAVWTDSSQTGDDTSSMAIRAQRFDDSGAKVGDEFLVNTNTAQGQYNSSVTGLGNGNFVVTWQDYSKATGDGSISAVRGQMYQANGTALGGEFLVNTQTSGTQGSPSITALAGGGWVATWMDASLAAGDTSGEAIRGQLYADDGTTVGDEFVINTTTDSNQRDPSVAALADGGFVVVFDDISTSGGDTDGWAVRGQVFAADGTKAGDEFLANTTTTGDQHFSAVSSLADGRFVVSWQDSSHTDPDTDGDAVRAQIFDARTAAVELTGTRGSDDFVGTKWKDTMQGRAGADHLSGEGGRDKLSGGGGGDQIDGGRGRDILSGAKGRDTFVFTDTADSAVRARKADHITDFKPGKDHIDLSAIDAREGGADQAFKFIGTKGFHGKAGELHAVKHGHTTWVQGDTDGDGKADFTIVLDHWLHLHGGDFIL